MNVRFIKGDNAALECNIVDVKIIDKEYYLIAQTADDLIEIKYSDKLFFDNKELTNPSNISLNVLIRFNGRRWSERLNIVLNRKPSLWRAKNRMIEAVKFVGVSDIKISRLVNSNEITVFATEIEVATASGDTEFIPIEDVYESQEDCLFFNEHHVKNLDGSEETIGGYVEHFSLTCDECRMISTLKELVEEMESKGLRIYGNSDESEIGIIKLQDTEEYRTFLDYTGNDNGEDAYSTNCIEKIVFPVSRKGVFMYEDSIVVLKKVK